MGEHRLGSLVGVLHTTSISKAADGWCLVAYGNTPACISVAGGHLLLQSHPLSGRHLPRPTTYVPSHTSRLGGGEGGGQFSTKALYQPSPISICSDPGLESLVCVCMIMMMLLLLMPIHAFRGILFGYYRTNTQVRERGKEEKKRKPRLSHQVLAPERRKRIPPVVGGGEERKREIRCIIVTLLRVGCLFAIVRHCPYWGRWTTSSVMGRRERAQRAAGWPGSSRSPPLSP